MEGLPATVAKPKGESTKKIKGISIRELIKHLLKIEIKDGELNTKFFS